MTDDPQPSLQQPQPENPFDAGILPQLMPPPPRKSKKRAWIIVVLAVICLCSAAGVVIVATGISKVMAERAPIELVLHNYMKQMDAKEVENAYALFSPRARRQFSVTQLEELIEGNNYALFEGYRNLSVQNIKVNATVNSDPNMPQGIVASVDGVVSYARGFEGSFNGVLEKVDGDWQIDSIFVYVSPDKIQP